MTTSARGVSVLSKPRTAWAREGGARCRYSTARVRAVLRQRRRAGWLAAMDPAGPRHERLTVLRSGHPLAFLVRAYGAGRRWFDRWRLALALGSGPDTPAGARRLAGAGFALVQTNGPQVKVRACDPRAARLLNRARLGRPYRGYDVHKVVAVFLCLAPNAKRRRPVTDDRRLAVALVLHDNWLIDCDDLLDGRPFVRLWSHWTWANADGR